MYSKDKNKNKWEIGEMTPAKFIEARAKKWSDGEGLLFTFENENGVKISDGFWFKKGMSKNSFENLFKRARHMVNVVKDNGWRDAGDWDGDALIFLQKVADQCNISKGSLFYLKTLFVLTDDGKKIPRFGKSVRFIAPYVKGESLSYSGEEEENPRYLINNI